MKICIAGGAGYVGSVLVPMLQGYNYDVTVIDLLWFGNHLPEGTKIIQKDLFSCTEKDFEGFDACINLSGISNDPGAEYDPVRNFIYNAALPPYLALMAKRAGVKRYIYASTASVYGFTYNELYDENSIISCNYPYGISKYASERGVLHLVDSDFSVICLRKATLNGMSPRMRGDLIINTMFLHAMTKGTITINNPSIWRPILSVSDAAMGYIRALQAHESIAGVFNLAENNYTVGDIAEIVKSIIESKTDKKIKFSVGNVKDVRNYKIDTSKAKTTLGFHPRYTVSDIVNELLNNWEELSKNISNDEYYNINICKKIFTEAVKL